MFSPTLLTLLLTLLPFHYLTISQPIENPPTETYNSFIIAGSLNLAGRDDGFGTNARFNFPIGILYTPIDSSLYVSDHYNNIIRKITVPSNASSPQVFVSTVAGSGEIGNRDGKGLNSTFFRTHLPSIDEYSDRILIPEYSGARIRVLDYDGTVTTMPYNLIMVRSVVFDSMGMMFASSEDFIYKINPQKGEVTRFAGAQSGYQDGLGTEVKFDGITALAIDSQDNLYASDYYNYRVRKISPAGNVTTLAGNSANSLQDGKGSLASFRGLRTLQLDRYDNLYVAGSHIRRITPDGNVSTVVSGVLSQGFTFDHKGNAYFTDSSNVVRKLVICYRYCSYNSTIRDCICSNCIAGSQYDAVSKSCSLCPLGQFKSSMGLHQCSQCPLTTESSRNRETCIPCPLGKERVHFNQSKCVFCQKGKYRSSTLWPQCIDCPVNSNCYTYGYECKPEFGFDNITATCHICPIGSYQYSDGPPEGNVTCMACSIGTESSPDRRSCKQCDANKYRPSLSLSTCINCPANATCNGTNFFCLAGHELNNNGTFCVPCGQGFVKSLIGNHNCTQCPIGKEPNSPNNTECLQCQLGKVKPSSEYLVCDDCPEGADCSDPTTIACQRGHEPSTNSSNSAISSCRKCADGYFKGSIGNFGCSPCQLGTFSSDDFSSCLKCTAGEYLKPDGSCEQCGVGQQPTASRTACEQCPAGKYKPLQFYRICLNCPYGADCDDKVEFKCRSGFEVNTYGTGCNPCQFGYYKAVSGNGQTCQSCVSGMQPTIERDGCEKCPKGTYRSTGTTSLLCIECPPFHKDCLTDRFTCESGYLLNDKQSACVPLSISSESIIITSDDGDFKSRKSGQDSFSWDRFYLYSITYAIATPVIIFILISIVVVDKWRRSLRDKTEVLRGGKSNYRDTRFSTWISGWSLSGRRTEVTELHSAFITVDKA